MARPKNVLASVGVVSVACGIIVACYSPTEVRIEISRDAACGTGGRAVTAIFVGEPGHGAIDPEVTTEDCNGNSIGSLVVVPRAHGDRDARVTVEVALAFGGKEPKACLVEATGCIVARRSFDFIAHTSRALPIKLYENCKDVTCLPGTTCLDKVCVSDDSNSFCTGEGCPPPAPSDAGLEADAAPVDGARDIALDAPPPPCTGANGDGVVAADVDRPTGKMVNLGGHLYWPSDRPRGVLSVSKSGGAVSTYQTTLNTPRAAVFDPFLRLWVAQGAQLWRIERMADGSAGAVSTFDLGATANGVAIASDVAIGSTQAGTYSVPLEALSNTAVTPFPNQGANFGAKALVWDHGYLYAQGNSNLIRVTNQDAIQSLPEPSPVDIVATDHGVYLSRTAGSGLSGVHFVADTMTSAAPIASLGSPAELALDGANVYVIDRPAPTTTAASIFVIANASLKALTKIPPLEEISGLVVDEACVYYWGRAALTGAKGAIRVAPK